MLGCEVCMYRTIFSVSICPVCDANERTGRCAGVRVHHARKPRGAGGPAGHAGPQGGRAGIHAPAAAHREREVVRPVPSEKKQARAVLKNVKMLSRYLEKVWWETGGQLVMFRSKRDGTYRNIGSVGSTTVCYICAGMCSSRTNEWRRPARGHTATPICPRQRRRAPRTTKPWGASSPPRTSPTGRKLPQHPPPPPQRAPAPPQPPPQRALPLLLWLLMVRRHLLNSLLHPNRKCAAPLLVPACRF